MVCQQLGISRSQLHVWLKPDQRGLGLQTHPGRAHKTAMHPMAKGVMKMAAEKRHQSTRKQLEGSPRQATRSPTCWSTSMCAKPKHAAIETEADAKTNGKATSPPPEVNARARALVGGGLAEGGLIGRVAFELSAVSPSELNKRPCVGGQHSDVPTVSSAKHTAKIPVWGMFSYRALSQLHAVPQKKNGHQWRVLLGQLLTNECLDSLNRTTQEG